MFRSVHWQVRRRFSIPLALSVLLSVVTLLVRGANEYIVQPAFDRLERAQAMEDATRVWRTIQREVAQLGGELGDWSNWDDTYEFATTRDLEYVRGNLGDWSVLERTTGINMCFIVGVTNDVLYSSVHSSRMGGTLPVPLFTAESPQLLTALQPVILRGAPLDGIVTTPFGLMAVAARPILTTEGRGPSRGAIMFGRFLDAPMMSRLAEQTRVAFQLLVDQSGDMAALRTGVILVS